jgi:hypothetical protein
MIAAGRKLISKDEKTDFLAGVKALGYKADEFVVTPGARADKPMGNEIHANRQEVRVDRASAKIWRTYDAGHGHAWAAAALTDVKRGVFGKK